MVKDKMEKGAHIGFPSFFHNSIAPGHPDTWCVCSRGAVSTRQLHSWVWCAGKSHSATYTTTIVKGEVAVVSVGILLICSFQMESLPELF